MRGDSFLIMVSGECSREDLLGLVLSSVPSARKIKSWSIETPFCWIEVRSNEHADGQKVGSSPDAYLYFEFRVEVTRKPGLSDADKMEALAESLQALLRQAGSQVVAC